MTTHVVPQKHTPCTGSQAAEAFWFAHQDVIGGPCPTELLVTLVIQWDLETAAGRACFCSNLGNMRGHGPDGATQAIKGANEVIDGKIVIQEAGFAAYVSHGDDMRANRIESASAMIRFLGTASKPPAPNRFAAAWEAANVGNLEEYANQIGKHVQGEGHSYMTDEPSHYAKTLRSREHASRVSVGVFLDSLNAPVAT